VLYVQVILFNSLSAWFEIVSSTLCHDSFFSLAFKAVFETRRLLASEMKGFKQGTRRC